MNLHIRHLARWGCGKLISLHAERVHGLTPRKSLKFGFHKVRLETGEIERGQVVQVVPEKMIALKNFLHLKHLNLVGRYLLVSSSTIAKAASLTPGSS